MNDDLSDELEADEIEEVKAAHKTNLYAILIIAVAMGVLLVAHHWIK